MKKMAFTLLAVISALSLHPIQVRADGSPCSMRFGYATVRNVRTSHLTTGACEFQITVSDPMTESGCSLDVGEVDGQLYQDPRCELSEGDSINGYVFRSASGKYEIDFYKNRRFYR